MYVVHAEHLFTSAIMMHQYLGFPIFLTQINAPFSDPKINRTELRAYSRVRISSDEVFSKILKKPSIVQK